MALARSAMRIGFAWMERALGSVFPAQWNPLLNLGALGFFLYWIITVSGIYLFIFYDTDVRGAWTSLEYISRDQWYAAGVMRSLHRYASDALVLVMALHMAREFALDRYRGVRWFSWITGVPVLVFVFVAGITGYWMVWDKLAQYIAIVTTEWLDRLPIFGEPIARNFLSPEALESRFFTLMVFIHIAVPLIALIMLWVHLQRVTKPRINPPRGLAIGVFLSMCALSLYHPAYSQAEANLAKVPGDVGLDWFYLPLYPLFDRLPGPVTWAGAAALLLILVLLPWLPPMRKPAAAKVDLANCNGCRRCFEDCPYNAITMGSRTDGMPFERQAVVSAALCTGCGICAGSCPTSTPFRKASALVPGIDLPDHTMAALRESVHEASSRLTGDKRILVFGCEQAVPAAELRSRSIVSVSLRCVGQLPPSFIDYVISRGLAEAIVISGCSPNGCYARFGADWTQARIDKTRDPHLRARVPMNRVKVHASGRLGGAELEALVKSFAEEVGKLTPPTKPAARERRELSPQTIHD